MTQTRTSLDLHGEHSKVRDGIETQITPVLPPINTTTEMAEFKKMLEQNLKQTAEHIARLEQILSTSS